MLEAFFESVVWPMETFKAYGLFHILYTLIGFGVCAWIAWKLRNVSDKTANRILLSIGTLLILSEIFKQFFCYYVIADNSYHWGEFPFQLCSVPMYLCVLVPALKPGKIRRALCSFMVLYNLLGGAISFAEPSGLFHEYWFLTMHSCLWHMFLVFIGLFLCLSQRGGTEKSDYLPATLVFIALCVVAFIFNCIVQFGLGEDMNMFFVGPGESPIIVFKQFCRWFGWYVNTFIYMLALCLGGYLVFLLTWGLRSKRLQRREKQPVG